MKYGYMQEKDIKVRINSPFLIPKERPRDFIVYMVDSFWNVKFTYLDKPDCKLRLKKRGKNEDIVTKDFASIDTVEACLREIGVDEFKVIINIE